MFLNELFPGDSAEGYFILESILVKTASNGKPFLSLVLGDRSGTMEAKVWDYRGPIGAGDTGAVAYLKGSVSKEFRGASPAHNRRSAARGRERPLPRERSRPRRAHRSEGFVASFRTMSIRSAIRLRRRLPRMLDEYGERFRTIPAAKSVHHSFLNGLLMHTLFMVETADFLAGQYAAVIDRSLLLAGTLLHDFLKCEVHDLSARSRDGLFNEGPTARSPRHGRAGRRARAAEDCSIPEESPCFTSISSSRTTASRNSRRFVRSARRRSCSARSTASTAAWRSTAKQLAELPQGEFSQRVFALDHRVYRHD